MALPTKKINKVTLPGDVNGSKTYDIVPTILSDGTTNYSATLPTLNQDSVIAVKSETKTYTGLIATSNEYKNASFYFINVMPDTWEKEWSVSYRVEVSLDAGATPTNYQQFGSIHECYISGARGYYSAYAFFNNINNTSYRCVYYALLQETTETSYNNNYPHKLGFELTGTASNTDTNYKRTFKITILDCSGCTVSFNDAPEIPSNSSRSDYTKLNSTAYPYPADSNAPGYACRYGIASQGLVETGDNNDTSILNYYNQFVTISSALGLCAYSLCGFDTNGNVQAFSKRSSSYTSYDTALSTDRVYNTTGIDYTRGMFRYNQSTYRETGTTAQMSFHKTIDAFDVRYTDNMNNASGTALTMVGTKALYIRGTIGSDGLFYLAPIEVTYNNTTYKRVWTQDTPTTEDGYVYWLVGFPYNTNSFTVSARLYVENPLYWFKDGEFREYSTTPQVKRFI